MSGTNKKPTGGLLAGYSDYARIQMGQRPINNTPVNNFLKTIKDCQKFNENIAAKPKKKGLFG
jgi:hypothetical protein